MKNKKNESIDYSKLVQATLEDDQFQLNKILDQIFKVLIFYLLGTMHCSKEDAEDCAQQAIMNILEKIKEKKIKDPERIFPYLLKSCRNNCLRLMRYNGKFISDEHFTYLTEPPRQLLNLLDEEEAAALKTCVATLSDLHKTFLDYMFNLPGIDANQIAEHFGISVASVWSRKHRIIRKLSKCVKTKLK